MNGFLRSFSLSLLALVVATRPCRASDPVSPAAEVEPEAKASNVQSLQFHGAVTWQINGGTVSFHAASVANIGTSTVPVSVSLMAATQPPRFGDDLSQARVLARTNVGSLPAGSQTGVDSGTIAFSRPPSGTYYIFASAEIFQNGTYVSQDIFSFPNTETFGATCTQDALTLCLGGGRFAVRSTWTVPSQGTSGVGGALPLVGGDTGYFWFFSSNAAELMVKMVDGRTLNGNFWVFYGALSNVQYTISITDTQTGGFKTYQNPSGNLASVADTSAFADGSGSGALAGTWRGTFNTTDPNCAGVTGAVGTGAFVQNGNNFAGTFNLPGNSSGSFQGSISGNTVSGVFTSNTAAGCNGTGNFTGTLSGNELTVSAPTITTPQQGCVFCQNNTIILTKTGG